MAAGRPRPPRPRPAAGRTRPPRGAKGDPMAKQNEQQAPAPTPAPATAAAKMEAIKAATAALARAEDKAKQARKEAAFYARKIEREDAAVLVARAALEAAEAAFAAPTAGA